ncbi:MAG: hypothetical protein AB7I35_12265 [Ramlibacter sp.]|nr:hypothetical protein [Ramlibacter sp.]
MTALTVARDTQRRENLQLSLPMSASKIYEGAIVCLSAAGYATKGAVATTLRAAGVAEATVDNSAGNAGDVSIDVKRGTFKFGNSASTDQITLADYGKDCYIVDDQTVAKTDGTGTRSVAGKIRGVDTDGVWVEF